MQIIEHIQIENFRSIRSLRMEDLDEYVPLTGLNSSGKSNVLRALNLFFNGFVDEDRQPPQMDVDLSTYLPQRKKKYIAVTVGMRLGASLKVPKQEDFHARHAIEDSLYIRRTWSLGLDQVSVVEGFQFGTTPDELKEADADDVASVLTHIRAVRFVYVPNHAKPADLIQQELEPLRSTMIARLRGSTAYRKSSVESLLTELGKMGDRMFGDLSDVFSAAIPDTSLEPDLPADFADLLFDVGVRAITDGYSRRPEFEGSGVQSYILLHILNLADRTRRAGGYGWVQASIWAIEEPESFLHAGLRAHFSSDLAAYAQDARRQVFVTTHQDEFVRVASSAWIATREPSTVLKRLSAREALSESTRRAITTFRHPLFTFTDGPLVVVEGKFDDVHLKAAMAASGLRPRWRLIAPGSVFGEEIGGDGVLPYLRYNRQVIASRPTSAPVIVLRDWEAKDAAKYDKVLAPHPYSRCLTAPEELANPELGDSFAGVERYLETALIETVIPARDLGRESSLPDARRSVKGRVLSDAKPKLADYVGETGDCGQYMVALVKWLDRQVVEILDTIPAAEFAAGAVTT